MARVEMPLDGPEDPGHLLSADEWAQVQSGAHTHVRTLAQTTTRAAALTVLDMPAKYHGGAQTPTVQVVHDAETPITDGYAVAIGKFFQGGPDAGTSAHRMIGPRTVVRMLDPHVIGYHVGPVGNRGTIGYEQCGYAAYTRTQWTSGDGLAQIDTLAGEIARDAEALGIPDRHLTDEQLRAWAAAGRPLALGGRCTHDQVHRVLGGTSHTDPTPGYPLDLLNAAITRRRNPDQEEIVDAAQEKRIIDGVVTKMTAVLRAGSVLGDVGTVRDRTIVPGFTAVQDAIDAIEADDAVDDAATAELKTLLQQVLGRLPAPAPAPTPTRGA